MSNPATLAIIGPGAASSNEEPISIQEPELAINQQEISGNQENRDSNSSTHSHEALLIQRNQFSSLTSCGPKQKRYICFGVSFFVFLAFIGLGIDMYFAWKRNFVTADIKQVNINLGSENHDLEVRTSIFAVMETRFHSVDAINKDQLCSLYLKPYGVNDTSDSILLTSIVATSLDTIKPMSFFGTNDIDSHDSMSARLGFNQVDFDIIRKWIGDRLIVAPLELDCDLSFNVNILTFIPVPYSRKLTYSVLVNTTLLSGQLMQFPVIQTSYSDNQNQHSNTASASETAFGNSPALSNSTSYDTPASSSVSVVLNNTISSTYSFETDYQFSLDLTTVMTNLSFPVFLEIPDIGLDIGYSPGANNSFTDQFVNWQFYNRRTVVNLVEEKLSLSSFLKVSCMSNNVVSFDKNCSLVSPLLFIINSIIVASTKSTAANTNVLVNFNGRRSFVSSLAQPTHAVSMVTYTPVNASHTSSSSNVNGQCLRTAFDDYSLSDGCYVQSAGYFGVDIHASNVVNFHTKIMWKQQEEDDLFVSAFFDFQLLYFPVSIYGVRYPLRLIASTLLDQRMHIFNMMANVTQHEMNEIGMSLQLVWPESTSSFLTPLPYNSSVPFSAATEFVYKNRVVFGADTAFTVISDNGLYTLLQDTGSVRVLGGDYLLGTWNIGGRVSDTGSMCNMTMNSMMRVPSVSHSDLWDVNGHVTYDDGKYSVLLMDGLSNSGFNVSGIFSRGTGISWNVTANDARLIFKGNKIVSGSMLSSFAMKDLPDKSTGTLLLDASDHSTTKYFPSISTANKLSWDIQKEPSATLASSLSVTSETRQTSSIASDRSQAKPLWVFSSELEYIAGAFIMGVSEGVSNSLAEVEGTYSYAGLRNWDVSVSRAYLSLIGGTVSSEFAFTTQVHVPIGGTTGLLSVFGKDLSTNMLHVFSIANTLSWNFDMYSANPGFFVASQLILPQPYSRQPTTEPTSEPTVEPTIEVTQYYVPQWYISSSSGQSCDDVCSTQGLVCASSSFSAVTSADAFANLVIGPMGYTCSSIQTGSITNTAYPEDISGDCNYGGGVGDCPTPGDGKRFCPCIYVSTRSPSESYIQTSRSTTSEPLSIPGWNGSITLSFAELPSTGGTLFTAQIEEQTSQLLVTGAGTLSGYADKWMLVLNSSALTIGEHFIGAMVGSVDFFVPRSENGRIGRLQVDVLPSLGTFILINTSSLLQWDVSALDRGWITLTSDASDSGLLTLARDQSTTSALMSYDPNKSHPLWTLTSRAEYQEGSFSVVLTETLTNSLIDASGRYSFVGARNWEFSISDLTMSLYGGTGGANVFSCSFRCYLPLDGKQGVLLVNGEDYSGQRKLVFSTLNSLTWNLNSDSQGQSQSPGILVSSQLTLPEAFPTYQPTSRPTQIARVPSPKNTVAYNGRVYSTLSDVKISGTLLSCQNSLIALPKDWVLAPFNNDTRTLATIYTWSTTTLVYSNGYAVTTKLWSTPNPFGISPGHIFYSNALYHNIHSLVPNEYTVNYCPCEILIMKNITYPTTSPTQIPTLPTVEPTQVPTVPTVEPTIQSFQWFNGDYYQSCDNVCISNGLVCDPISFSAITNVDAFKRLVLNPLGITCSSIKEGDAAYPYYPAKNSWDGTCFYGGGAGDCSTYFFAGNRFCPCAFSASPTVEPTTSEPTVSSAPTVEVLTPKNIVTYNGQEYSTLSDVVITGLKCSSQFGSYIALPSGWVIAPLNHDTAILASMYPWSAFYLAYSNGQVVGTNQDSFSGQVFPYYPNAILNIGNTFSVQYFGVQILITRVYPSASPTSKPTSPTVEPSYKPTIPTAKPSTIPSSTPTNFNPLQWYLASDSSQSCNDVCWSHGRTCNPITFSTITNAESFVNFIITPLGITCSSILQGYGANPYYPEDISGTCYFGSGAGDCSSFDWGKRFCPCAISASPTIEPSIGPTVSFAPTIETPIPVNTVTYNGRVYSTLSDVVINGTSFGCQYGTYYSLPKGWILAPFNSETMALASEYTWSTSFIAFSNGMCVATANYQNPKGYMFQNGMLDNIGSAYSVPFCNAEIMIMRIMINPSFSPTNAFTSRSSAGTANSVHLVSAFALKQVLFSPSRSPSVGPSSYSSVGPSSYSSVGPSRSPTVGPSQSSSVGPSRSPTVEPSRYLSGLSPTVGPTSFSRPTKLPVSNPPNGPITITPTMSTSFPSTNAPLSQHPSRKPSRSFSPSTEQSTEPSTEPSIEQSTSTDSPFKRPSSMPIKRPSRRPTSKPHSSKPHSSSSYSSKPLTNGASPVTLKCPVFSVTNTYSASINFATCSFIACGGSVMSINSVCSGYPGTGSCKGDTYIRLVKENGVEVASNDDSCGACSSLKYYIPFYEPCQTYSLREGCYDSSSCSGQFVISGLPVSGSPTEDPTFEPSYESSLEPTAEPSSPTSMPVTSSPSIALTRDIWNGTASLTFSDSISTGGALSTAFTAHFEEQTSRVLLTGAGYLSGYVDNWLFALSSSAMTIGGHLIGSVIGSVAYEVPRSRNSLTGRLQVDVLPTLGTFLLINTSSALQWDISTTNAGCITLTSDAKDVGLKTLTDDGGSTAVVTNQISHPLWALTGTVEYGGGSFVAVANEKLSNSLVDAIGHYSFVGARNWSLSVQNLEVVVGASDVLSASGDVHIFVPDLATKQGSMSANLLSRKGIVASSSNNLDWKFGTNLAHIDLNSNSNVNLSPSYKIGGLLDVDFATKKSLDLKVDYIPRNVTQLLAATSLHLSSVMPSTFSLQAIWNARTIFNILGSWMYNMTYYAISPTVSPTSVPTQLVKNPSRRPTKSPHFPTSIPSYRPSTIAPTSPTSLPSTNSPLSQHPSRTPTLPPSIVPSPYPTSEPSFKPSSSRKPTKLPHYPSVSPSSSPSTIGPTSPTVTPSTNSPLSQHPSLIPSKPPSIVPTSFPTGEPSFLPSSSRKPTKLPYYPSVSPSFSPSTIGPSSPTVVPSTNSPFSQHPSLIPSRVPSFVPTASPTYEPSFKPSASRRPTKSPHYPSISPSINPSTISPTSPTFVPSTNSPVSQHPSKLPVQPPSSSPTTVPTDEPSFAPSPSNGEIDLPSLQPSKFPYSASPISIPSLTPSTVSPSQIPSPGPSQKDKQSASSATANASLSTPVIASVAVVGALVLIAAAIYVVVFKATLLQLPFLQAQVPTQEKIPVDPHAFADENPLFVKPVPH